MKSYFILHVFPDFISVVVEANGMMATDAFSKEQLQRLSIEEFQAALAEMQKKLIQQVRTPEPRVAK